MSKKYELTDEFKEIEDNNGNSKKLYRIRALRDIGYIKKGNTGGFIESEDNLSHEGSCWVSSDAVVMDNASVRDDAKVIGRSVIKENAEIFGRALVSNETEVKGSAKIYENAKVSLEGYQSVGDNVRIFGDASIYREIILKGSVTICGDTHLEGNYLCLSEDIVIKSNLDFLIFHETTKIMPMSVFWARSNNKWYKFAGCGKGYTADEFIDMFYKNDEISERLFRMWVGISVKLNKKYVLLGDDTITVKDWLGNNHRLHRIKALYHFSDIKPGDLGGYVESYDNLSHEGKCWLYDKSISFERSRVEGNATLHGESRIFGSAIIKENAKMDGSPRVYGNAEIFGSATLISNASVTNSAKVYGDAFLGGHCNVSGRSEICDNALVNEWANVMGNSCIRGNAKVGEFINISDSVIEGDVELYDKISVDGKVIRSNDDFELFNSLIDEERIVWFRNEDEVSFGSLRLNGSIDELLSCKTLTEEQKIVLNSIKQIIDVRKNK